LGVPRLVVDDQKARHVGVEPLPLGGVELAGPRRAQHDRLDRPHDILDVVRRLEPLTNLRFGTRCPAGYTGGVLRPWLPLLLVCAPAGCTLLVTADDRDQADACGVWTKVAGGVLMENDTFSAVATTEDCRVHELINRGGSDIMVVSYARNGQVEWARGFGGLFDDACEAIAILGDGDIAIGGTVSGGSEYPAISFDSARL
jgi:hypothetical protein